MGEFVCVYYQTNAGKAPVHEFIASLDERTQEKYIELVEQLEYWGKNLTRPSAAYLGNDIYEMRFVGIEGQVRVLYFFYFENKIIFTNGFIKKKQKVPKMELQLAKDRKKHYCEQHKG